MNSAIVNVVITAYNAGLLQYEPMTICGFTVKMDVKRKMNQLTVTYLGKTLSVMVYDNDSESCQESTIDNLITDLAHMADNR